MPYPKNALMRVLVIGGSAFLGRAFVTEALARGHEVTTFNRGRATPTSRERRPCTATGR
ncbi:NAD-dependent epimerase/dehydratase family protein [Nonomuraea dietziae]|uniref:NAD-dependent epimerase/dehydratase family protein n=1 Tax=Nonomuraea dietziae TaxID=65515 RepID=UPI00360BFEE3